MKTTLKRLGNGDYKLYNTDGSCMATTKESPYKKLSVKNCDEIFEIIEVEKLAREYVDNSPNDFEYTTDEYWNAQVDFKAGFNKAMELMEGKKYSEEDIRDAFSEGVENGFYRHRNGHKYVDDYIKSLQQPTEIEVEIEMVCPHPSDTYRCGLEFGCDEDGCNNPNQIPYLDKDGCLILRKI